MIIIINYNYYRCWLWRGFFYHIHKTVDLTIDNRKEQTLDSPSTMGIIMGIQLASSNMCNTYIIIYIYIYIVWIHIKGVRMRFTINNTGKIRKQMGIDGAFF